MNSFIGVRRKEMLYLMMYSKHSYDGYMAKDHSMKGNPLPPLQEILFSISKKGYFICTNTTQYSTYHILCNKPWSTGWNAPYYFIKI